MSTRPTPVDLAITDLGDGTPVVILHGLFGRRRNWQGLQKRLAGSARIITADMRNHGDSGWSEDMSYEGMAADIGGLIERMDIGPAVVVGHSMGGKASMALALNHPETVRALMVIDIAPVTYTHDYTPYIDAMKEVPLADLERRSEAEDYLKDAVPEPAIRAFLLQNLGQDDDRLKWQVNLDAIGANMNHILDFPGLAGDPYEGTTLFLGGGKSDYIQDNHHPAIETLFPMATFATIEGAGHWVHAEKPTEVIHHIEEFAAAAE